MQEINHKNLYRKHILVFIINAFLLVVVLLLPKIIHATAIYEILSKDDEIGGQVKKIWQYVLNTINLFVILVLIIVAFSQILRLNISTYGVKKVLPAILLASIAANFSFLFCRLLIDVSSVITSYLLVGPKSNLAELRSDPNVIVGAFNSFSNKLFLSEALDQGIAMTFWYIIGEVLIIVGAIMILILAFLFFIRNWIIYFLIPLAPLALMATILPQTKSLFNQWWSNFSKWVFMPVVAVFWLWLGGLWFETMNKNASVLLNYAFAVLCYYLAFTTPFKLGGSVMSTWSGLGKKAWGKTGGIGVGAAKNSFMTRYDRQKDKLSNRFYEGRLMGRGIPNWIQGNKDRQQFYTQQEKDVKAKREKDSLRDFYGRMYAQEYLRRVPGGPGARMNNASYSRMKAFMRTQTREELPTYASMIPDDIETQLRSHNALDGSGKLKNEQQLMRDIMAGPGGGRVTPEDLVHIKAIRDKARSMLNNTKTFQDTERVMGNIIPAHALNSWFSGDIAGDVYQDPTNALPVSAIGPSSTTQSAQLNIINMTKDPRVAQQVISAAQYGSDPPHVIVDRFGLKGEAALAHISEIRKGRDRMVGEELSTKLSNVEDIKSALQMLTSHSGEDLQGHVATTRKNLDLAEKHLNLGEIGEAKKLIEGVSGTIVAQKGEEEQEIRKRMEHIGEGVDYLDRLERSVQAPHSANPKAGEEIVKRVYEKIKNNPGGFITGASQHLEGQARADAHYSVGATNIMGSITSASKNPNITVTQLTAPEHIGTITQAIDGLQRTIAQSGQGAPSRISQIDPEVTKKVIADTINKSISGGIITEKTTISEAQSNPAFRDALADGMKRAQRESPTANTPKNPTAASTPTNTPPPSTTPPK